MDPAERHPRSRRRTRRRKPSTSKTPDCLECIRNPSESFRNFVMDTPWCGALRHIISRDEPQLVEKLEPQRTHTPHHCYARRPGKPLPFHHDAQVRTTTRERPSYLMPMPRGIDSPWREPEDSGEEDIIEEIDFFAGVSESDDEFFDQFGPRDLPLEEDYPDCSPDNSYYKYPDQQLQSGLTTNYGARRDGGGAVQSSQRRRRAPRRRAKRKQCLDTLTTVQVTRPPTSLQAPFPPTSLQAPFPTTSLQAPFPTTTTLFQVPEVTRPTTPFQVPEVTRPTPLYQQLLRTMQPSPFQVAEVTRPTTLFQLPEVTRPTPLYQQLLRTMQPSPFQVPEVTRPTTPVQVAEVTRPSAPFQVPQAPVPRPRKLLPLPLGSPVAPVPKPRIRFLVTDGHSSTALPSTALPSTALPSTALPSTALPTLATQQRSSTHTHRQATHRCKPALAYVIGQKFWLPSQELSLRTDFRKLSPRFVGL
ncbi:uncharacterized protein LOC144192824 [Stigmatopora nigra]